MSKKNNPSNQNQNNCPDNKKENPMNKKTPSNEVPDSNNKKDFKNPEMFKDSDYRS